MAEHFMKLENNNESVFDVNMDLNELFKETFGEPIIDMSLSFEETMERFLQDLGESGSVGLGNIPY